MDRKWLFLAVSFSLTTESNPAVKINGKLSLLLTFSADLSGFNLSKTEIHLIHTTNQPTAYQERGERNLSLASEAKWETQLPNHVQPIICKAHVPSLETTAAEDVMADAQKMVDFPPS